MANYTDITPGKTPAASLDVQQIINAWSGRANIPQALFTNDAIAYSLTVKNTDPSGRAVVIYAPDGTTVLFSIDASGVKISPAGGAAVAPLTDVGPASDQVAVGNHVHGAGGYSGTGATTLEALYAGATISVSTNHTVGANEQYIVCTAGVTVTLPDATVTNRPITIDAITGTTTVVAAAGSVIGGSTNTTTGAVMDGVVSPGDAIVYKSDGAAWRSQS
jgi:hypothetical protein